MSQLQQESTNHLQVLQQTHSSCTDCPLHHTLPKGSVRGYTFKYEDIPVLSTWHPAYILRRQDKRQELVNDLQGAFATGEAQ